MGRVWELYWLDDCPMAVKGREVERREGGKARPVVLLLIVTLGGARRGTGRSDGGLGGVRGGVSEVAGESEDDDGGVAGKQWILEELAGAARSTGGILAPAEGLITLACC